MVRLKGKVSENPFPCVYVSIPYGTIKSQRKGELHWSRNVSIPYGTIKSSYRERIRIPADQVSIPYGTIKR